MKWTNFHQHSHYDDGTKAVEEHVAAAIEQGIVSLGFSGHCPVPFANHWSMLKEDLSSYFADIDQAVAKNDGQIQLYKSLEVDYIPGMISLNDAWIKSLPLDYTLGSVHFVGSYENGRPWEIDGPHKTFLNGLENIYQGDVQYVVRKYFELIRKMIKVACPDVICHIDKIKMQNRGFWSEDDSWYQEEVFNTLEEIKSTDAIVEVNTRGMYKKLTIEPYPGRWILERIHQMNIPIQLNSDAHHPSEITRYFKDMAKLFKSIGFKELWIFLDHKWQPMPFDENGLLNL